LRAGSFSLCRDPFDARISPSSERDRVHHMLCDVDCGGADADGGAIGSFFAEGFSNQIVTCCGALAECGAFVECGGFSIADRDGPAIARGSGVACCSGVGAGIGNFLLEPGDRVVSDRGTRRTNGERSGRHTLYLR
jgi:hypothetical protein